MTEIAPQLKVTEEKVASWENGTDHPSLNQAKDLAKRYRVPFVYFYLPSVPMKTKRIDKVDYRTFAGISESIFMSRELRWLLRDVEERRDTMLELYAMEEMQPYKQDIVIPDDANDETIANAIRNLLALDNDKQISFRKPENALAYCIAQLERRDFLVFQASAIDTSEMRGLSAAYEIFPIIVLNRKDEQSARLFTLCHEFVHIFKRTSGICNDTGNEASNPKAQELFCNRVAGLALVPTNMLLSNQHTTHIKTYGMDDTEICALGRDFAVSREVILNRLWHSGIISEKLCFDTLKRYTAEYLAYKKQKKAGFLTPALDKGTQVGKLYARTVLSAFNSEKISPRDASGYLLNLHVQHFGRIERWCY
ncbi:MAG: XRE family transcriptional regulator [Clostridia bacterium]